MEFLSKSLEETKKIAEDFFHKLPKKDKATLVCLSGNLGSGKTAFVKCIAKILGVEDDITSPTFVIMKNYSPLSTIYKLMVHIDAYRLKNGKELENLRWQEIISDPQNIIFLEWPEMVADVLPKDAIEIKFEFVDENTRKLTF